MIGGGETVSTTKYNDENWFDAIVPETVRNTLVSDKVYSEPYFGDNNRLSRKLIPEIADFKHGNVRVVDVFTINYVNLNKKPNRSIDRDSISNL